MGTGVTIGGVLGRGVATGVGFDLWKKFHRDLGFAETEVADD